MGRSSVPQFIFQLIDDDEIIINNKADGTLNEAVIATNRYSAGLLKHILEKEGIYVKYSNRRTIAGTLNISSEYLKFDNYNENTDDGWTAYEIVKK